MNSKWILKLFLLQGVFYLGSGAWPFVHLNSFLAVTGPKTDIWLLYTVSLFIISGATVLLVAYIRRTPEFFVILMALLNATVLAGIDVYYSATGVISKVYLWDAGVEVLFIATWVVTLVRKTYLKN